MAGMDPLGWVGSTIDGQFVVESVAGEGAFGLTRADWRRAARGQARTLDQYLDLLGLPSGGALRASVGLASTVDDVERFLAFVELTYTDRVVGTAGLAPRQGC